MKAYFGEEISTFHVEQWRDAMEAIAEGSAVFAVIRKNIISLIMMAVPGIPIWVAIIVDVILLAITCTLVISGDVAKTAIEKTEEKVQTKTAFIKGLKADVDILLSEERDPVTKKELVKLADDIRYSDSMSNSELEEIEKQIADKIAAIATAGDSKQDLISEVTELIKQRNIKCKALK